MQGKILSFTNLRANKSHTSMDLGDLLDGDIITFTHKEQGSDGLTYCWVVDATRSGIPVRRTDGKTLAEAPCWAYTGNMQELGEPVPAPEPEPVPTVKPLTVTIEGENYKTVVVTLEPK